MPSGKRILPCHSKGTQISGQCSEQVSQASLACLMHVFALSSCHSYMQYLIPLATCRLISPLNLSNNPCKLDTSQGEAQWANYYKTGELDLNCFKLPPDITMTKAFSQPPPQTSHASAASLRTSLPTKAMTVSGDAVHHEMVALGLESPE